MKTAFLTLFSLCFAAGAFAQTPTDTIFLLKEKKPYHAVYIENNKAAASYKQVLDFTVTRDGLAYKQSIDYLNKKYPQPAQRYNTLGISGKWYPLYRYQGNYYLYAPCDNIYQGAFSIAFDGVTDMTPEGFVFSRITSFSKTGKSHTFVLDNDSGGMTRTIHIIDAEKGIAVIEERSGTNAPEYRLAVHSVTAASFPLIVNDCNGEKQAEYEFDKPDYQALLKNRK